MSNSSKSKAAIARKAKNKLRPAPPREFICLVGGPSNSFNGWYAGLYRAANPDDMILVGGPPPRTRTDIRYYLNFRVRTIRKDGTPYVVDPNNEQEMREHGWWRGSYDKVIARGWSPSEVISTASGTHDIYWGNFAVAASRLYFISDLPDPTIRPEPRRGDIVTFMVYAPAYDKRQKVDYAASPYNFNHKDKAIVDKKANPRAAEYWKSSPITNVTRVPLPPSSGWKPPAEAAREARDRELVLKEIEAEKKRPIGEDDINFHILMQTTADRDDKYLFRINGYDSYRAWILYHVLGSVKAPDVLSKVIFFNEPSEFVAYCNSGTFSRADGQALEEGQDYDMLPPRPVPKDTHGRPLPRNYAWFKHWDSTPNVNRDKIKICRFDYFGHSDDREMMLEYGWSNPDGSEQKKGQPPNSSVVLTIDTLKPAFPAGALTADAHASLWGCNLGDAGGIGSQLADLFRGGVIAADTRTDFSQIIVTDTEMPFPVVEKWNAATGQWENQRGKFRKLPAAASAVGGP